MSKPTVTYLVSWPNSNPATLSSPLSLHSSRSVTVKKASGLGKLKAIVKLLVTGRRRRHGEGSGDRASAGEGAGGKGLWKGTKDSLKVRRAESRVLVANDDDDDDGLFDYTSVW